MNIKLTIENPYEMNFFHLRIFIQLLEAIHPEDAEIMIDMVQRKAPKGLTKKIVEEAFPKLLS